jgi:hypothetical protein
MYKTDVAASALRLRYGIAFGRRLLSLKARFSLCQYIKKA